MGRTRCCPYLRAFLRFARLMVQIDLPVASALSNESNLDWIMVVFRIFNPDNVVSIDIIASP